MEYGPLEKIKSMALEFRILKDINDGETYPYSLLKRFEKLKFGKGRFKISKSDIYNAVAALERKHYIKVAKRRGAKKYYTITKEGKEVISKSKKILTDAIKEISKLL